VLEIRGARVKRAPRRRSTRAAPPLASALDHLEVVDHRGCPVRGIVEQDGDRG